MTRPPPSPPPNLRRATALEAGRDELCSSCERATFPPVRKSQKGVCFRYSATVGRAHVCDDFLRRCPIDST